MRLLDLIEQYHAVGLAAYGLGELAALVVAHVSRRRSDQTRDGELLHILGHIDADDVVLIVEQTFGQSFGQLRLAHARGAEEQERAYGAVGIGDAGAGAENGLGDTLHGLVLTYHAAVQEIVQMQQLLTLALHQLADGDPGPLGDDPGDLLFGDGVVHHGVRLAVGLGLFGFLQLLFQSREVGVFESGCRLVFIAQLRVLYVRMQLFKARLELFDLVHAVLFGFPAGLALVEVVLQLGQLRAQLLQPVAAEFVVLLLERHLLDLQLHDPAALIVQFSGHGVDLCADQSAGFVHKVDGLVRQETVGDIAMGQRGRGDESAVVDTNAVIDLIAFLQTSEDRDRILHGGLVHLHGLEAALQSRVLLDIFAVLVQSGGADAVELAARQHGLEQVACVHAAFCAARSHNGVELVDEQNDAALALADLLQNGFEALLKLAAVLGAGDQRAHIQREDRFVLQSLGHIPAHDPLGQTFGDGGFANARLADQDGVVLGLAREDADHIADLAVTADDGIGLIVPGALHQIGAVFLQRVVGAFRVVAGDGGGLYLAQFLGEGGLGDAVIGKYPLDSRGGRGKDADHQVLNGDIFVPHGLGGRLRGAESPVRLLGEIGVRSLAHLGQGGDGGIQLREHGVAVDAHPAQQRGDQTSVLVDERVEQVLGHYVIVAVLPRHGLGGTDRFKAFLGVVLHIHGTNLLLYERIYILC